MFFDDIVKIPVIAQNVGFSIFATKQGFMPNSVSFNAQTYYVEPKDDKIRIDQIREINDFVQTKPSDDRFIIISQADTMNQEAQNALLKLLEEPGEHYHFVLFVSEPNKLLETVLSRGEIYFLRDQNSRSTYNEEVRTLAKNMITAYGNQLVQLADTLTNKKIHKNPRSSSLEITAAAIDILYHSYLETKNPKFLKKLTQLLNLHQNLTENGHVKLHIVADLC